MTIEQVMNLKEGGSVVYVGIKLPYLRYQQKYFVADIDREHGRFDLRSYPNIDNDFGNVNIVDIHDIGRNFIIPSEDEFYIGDSAILIEDGTMRHALISNNNAVSLVSLGINVREDMAPKIKYSNSLSCIPYPRVEDGVFVFNGDENDIEIDKSNLIKTRNPIDFLFQMHYERNKPIQAGYYMNTVDSEPVLVKQVLISTSNKSKTYLCSLPDSDCIIHKIPERELYFNDTDSVIDARPLKFAKNEYNIGDIIEEVGGYTYAITDVLFDGFDQSIDFQYSYVVAELSPDGTVTPNKEISSRYMNDIHGYLEDRQKFMELDEVERKIRNNK